MTDSRTRLASVALAMVMVLSVVAAGGAVAGTSGNDATAGNDASTEEPTEEPTETESGDTPTESPSGDSFVVQQGGDCYAVSTLGDGSETVESFYNYSADYDWSSEGTKHLQENQVSNLFVYEGSEGYSLVFVHDEHGDGPYGGTLTFTVDGQPADGEWAVEDDDYQGRDDNFDHHGTYSEIDWKWAPDRNDGAAFRGLTAEDDVAITIDPAFNEEANAWGEWSYSGDEDNRTESWQLLGEDGEPVTTLDMSQNVTVTTGSCGSGVTAALSANDSSVTTDQPVEFDASGSASSETIVEYHWDFDGDGETDATTESATTTHAYATDGEFDATVTAVDESGDEDAASTTITVSADEQTDGEPTAELDAPSEATVDSKVTLNASASSDDEGIVKYHWDLDGDGETDEKTTKATYDKWATYTGEFDITVTVEDADDNTDTASTKLTVTDDENSDDSKDSEDSKDSDDKNSDDSKDSDDSNSDDESNDDDTDESDTNDDSNDSDDDSSITPIGNDHDTDDDEPDISVTSVNVSADEVTVGENVTVNVTLTNDGDDEGTHTVTLSASGPIENATDENVTAENATSENASVDVDADETRNVTLTTSFATAGEYNVSVDDQTVALSVTENETETDESDEMESDESNEMDADESDEMNDATDTETESDDDAGGAQEPDGDDSATGASGPGFGALSVLVAALVGVGMLVRRQ